MCGVQSHGGKDVTCGPVYCLAILGSDCFMLCKLSRIRSRVYEGQILQGDSK